jgi:hypothetical protein
MTVGQHLRRSHISIHQRHYGSNLRSSGVDTSSRCRKVVELATSWLELMANFPDVWNLTSRRLNRVVDLVEGVTSWQCALPALVPSIFKFTALVVNRSLAWSITE